MRQLSQYLLTHADRRVLRWTDIYSLHRIVYDLFDDVRGADRQTGSGILFADKGVRQGVSRILILSDRPPRLPQRGALETRPLPESYLQATFYQFETTVNPVWRDNRSGKLLPVRGREAIAAWFRDHGSRWGFAVHEASLQVTEIRVDRFPKAGATATIARATLTGTLAVTERGAFVRAVCQGIGRARAFGCGLLQIIPCEHTGILPGKLAGEPAHD